MHHAVKNLALLAAWREMRKEKTMPFMTKRDRLQATLAGQTVDRPAVALWRHFPGDDQRAEDLAAAQLAFQRLYDFDLLKVSPASSFCVEDWGARDRYLGNLEGTREYYHYPVASPEDWRRLPVLDPAQGALGRQLLCLEIVGQELRQQADETPFIQTVFSPLAQAKNLAGSERMLILMRQDAAAFKAGLETITRTTNAFVEAAKRSRMAGIFYAVQHARYGLMSEAEYREFGEPYDRRVLEHLDGAWFNVLHIHGQDVMFDLLADYPVQAINWHDQETWPSLREARARTDKVLLGGLGRIETMMRGTPDDVRAKVADAMAQTGGKRFILGVGCVTMIVTPWGNIAAARQAVQDHRREP
jgi:uroporphyrinogen decarboxylase